jgi:hypothetical protein
MNDHAHRFPFEEPPPDLFWQIVFGIEAAFAAVLFAIGVML